MTQIRTTYEEWKTVPRQARSMSYLPSVGTVNSQLAAPLMWDGGSKAWTGSAEQCEALANKLEAEAERFLDRYDGEGVGIADRLTAKQARRYLAVAASIREQVAS